MEEPPAMMIPTPSTTPPLLPVTLISGFLGAGKSTLLRNILEAKHHSNQKKFRCAVLVNDMAELNIDQALIETTGLVASDEVISMQNGCVCCNLAGDMIDQIIKLTQQTDTPFDYLIIEASGVSEPAAICSLFHTETHNHDHHDHDHDHDESTATNTSLGEVAQMDTIVTVVDASEFLENLEKMEDPNRKDYARLLVEQVEYSNVVLLNKTDLVSPRQLQDVKDKVVLLTNGFGKIVECENSQVEVDKVVQTGLYHAQDFDFSKFVAEHFAVENEKAKPPKSCCSTAKNNGESPCCRRARTLDSGKSQILLPSKQLSKTRHGEQDKITSFVYTSRRPFVPSALYDNFVDRFFLSEDTVEDDDDDDDEDRDNDDDENDDHAAPPPEKKKAKVDEEEDAIVQARLAATIYKMQEDGARKKTDRIDALGHLLRLKGYLWQGNSHDLIGYISTAGNLSRIESPGRWNCLQPQSYQGTPDEQAANRKNHHWEGVYGDRRQELVFIGQDLNHLKIQELLDDCLLSDAQMALGSDGWKATFGDVILDDQ